MVMLLVCEARMRSSSVGLAATTSDMSEIVYLLPLSQDMSWPKQNFSDVMRTDDVIYDVTVGNVKHSSQTF